MQLKEYKIRQFFFTGERWLNVKCLILGLSYKDKVWSRDGAGVQSSAKKSHFLAGCFEILYGAISKRSYEVDLGNNFMKAAN